MQTLPDTIDRLLDALETLASAESVLLASEAWSELAVIQERSAAVVEKLVSLMGTPNASSQLDSHVFTRVKAITEDQDAKIESLDHQRTACGAALRELDESRQKVRHFRPAYRAPSVPTIVGSFARQA